MRMLSREDSFKAIGETMETLGQLLPDGSQIALIVWGAATESGKPITVANGPITPDVIKALSNISRPRAIYDGATKVVSERQ